MSPTFQAMQKLARGFAIELVELFGEASSPCAAAGSWLGPGRVSTDTPNYGPRLFTSELKNAAFLAVEVTVRARSLDAFEDWERHDSDDFLYVLAGGSGCSPNITARSTSAPATRCISTPAWATPRSPAARARRGALQVTAPAR